jgi:hypothetical protein
MTNPLDEVSLWNIARTGISLWSNSAASSPKSLDCRANGEQPHEDVVLGFDLDALPHDRVGLKGGTAQSASVEPMARINPGGAVKRGTG